MSLKPPRESLLNYRYSTPGLFFFLFLPFDVLEGNEVTQARLDFNEPLRASKDRSSIFFLSVQNRYFNDRFWSLDPEQCQSHYRVSEPTAPFEALGGTPPVTHVRITAIFLGRIYVECLGAASGLFIQLEFSVTFCCDVLFVLPWKFFLRTQDICVVCILPLSPPAAAHFMI